MTHFTILDGSIVGVYILLTMIAGLAVRKYVGKVEHFLLAGREMNIYLGVASLAATEFGIVTCMYTAQNGYDYGFAGSTPGILNAMSHVVPFEHVFSFEDAAEFETKAREIALTYVPRLVGKSFHVRLHRRGLKGTISTPTEERFLDEALLEALAAAGGPGRISFEDHDCVLLIETVGKSGGLTLWTREELKRYPFLPA